MIRSAVLAGSAAMAALARPSEQVKIKVVLVVFTVVPKSNSKEQVDECAYFRNYQCEITETGNFFEFLFH